MRRLVLLLFAALFAALFCFNLAALWLCRGQFLPLENWLPFLSGFLCYFVFAFAVKKFLKRDFGFAITFVHELNHTVFAALHLRKVSSFNAHESKGGEMSYAGKPTPLIVLAPYSVPIVSLPLLLLGCFVVEAAVPWVTRAVGFSLGFYLHALKHDFHLGQTDFYVYGLPFSLSFIAWLNSALLPSVVLASCFSFGRVLEFWLAAFRFGKGFLLSLFAG